MVTIHIDGKIVSKNDLKNYEIVIEDGRVVSFRERENNEKDKREDTA